MTLYYSKSAGGFYDDALHAKSKIPSDAVAITADAHRSLMAAQAKGQVIQADATGSPLAVNRPAYVPTEKDQIAALEASITPRRLREAVLGVDNGWLRQRNDEIAALRAKV